MRIRWRMLPYPLLVAVTLVVYWQTIGFEFVNMDDFTYITRNPNVLKGLSFENLEWAFTTTYFANWHPLTWLSFMLDVELYGQNAGGFHLTNVAWHVANVLLLFAVLRQMTHATWKSAFVAALFAVHPLHVESVAWISERKDVLSTFFGLLAIGAYARYTRHLKFTWYLAALVAFTLSLMSKQTLVTLPFVLLLLDFWPLNRFVCNAPDSGQVAEQQRALPKTDHRWVTDSHRRWQRLLLEKLPFFVLSALFCVVAVIAQMGGGGMRLSTQLSLVTRCLNAVVAYVLYIKKTFWPINLAAFYPHPQESIATAEVIAAALILVLVTVAVLAAAKRCPYLPVGWFWFLGTLVPVIGLVQIGEHQMADRYTYVPIIGLFVSVTWLVSQICGQRALLLVGGAGLIVVLTATASVQTFYWSGSISLFEHALSVTDGNYLAHANLGGAFQDVGRFEDAVFHYQAALKIKPKHAISHNNLGSIRYKQGEHDVAIQHYKQALEGDPTYGEAHYNLSKVYRDRGRMEESIHHFQKALLLVHPQVELLHRAEYTQSHFGLGVMLRDRGRMDEAIYHFRKAVSIDPSNSLAHNGLGIVLLRQGKRDLAIIHFRKALFLDPKLSDAEENLRRALSQ